MTRSLTLAKSGPVDHVAACREHLERARGHANAAEAEIIAGIRHNAAEAREFAKLPTTKAGVRDELNRLADQMEAFAQRIAAISSKGGM